MHPKVVNSECNSIQMTKIMRNNFDTQVLWTQNIITAPLLISIIPMYATILILYSTTALTASKRGFLHLVNFVILRG